MMPLQAPLKAHPSAPPLPAEAAGEADEFDIFSGDRSFVMSFARGVSVIQAFSNTSRPLTIAEISHRVHIPRAAVRRLLHTLSELGYVRTQDQRYLLSPKTLQLGNAFSSSNEFSIGVQPIAHRLAERLQCFSALLVQEGDDTMLVCTAGSSAPQAKLGVHKPAPGARAPLYASASGVMFLSALSDAQLEAYFQRVAMRPLTFRTPTVPAQIRESIQRARALGHADCDRTFANELRAVAVPVRDRNGHIVAALAAVGPIERFTDQRVQELILPELEAAVGEASRFWS